jgi:hypothetical protein
MLVSLCLALSIQGLGYFLLGFIFSNIEALLESLILAQDERWRRA